MGLNSLLRNERFSIAFTVFGIISGFFLLNAIFLFGGDEGFEMITTIASPIVALAASALFFRNRAIVKDPRFQQMWLWMGMGFGLWGLADLIWAIYTVTSSEVPAVSIADLVYIIGYVPLYAAIIARRRTIDANVTIRQRAIIGVINTAWTVFALLAAVRPIMVNFDPEVAFEGIVYLMYPLGDLGLVIVASLILFLLGRGRYSLSWRLILTGMLIMAFSDILYNYASWNDLYYPEGRANLVSNLSDTSYVLAYLVSGFGAYIYSLLWGIKELPDMRITLTPSGYYHAFAGTNRENQVISTSENLSLLLNDKPASSYFRLPLADACGMDVKTVQRLMDKLLNKGSIYLEPVTITTADRKTREVLLSGLATYDTEKEFTGVNLVFRSDMKAPEGLQLPQSRDLQSITRYVLAESGAEVKERDQALRSYFLETMRLLFSVLYQFGGDGQKDEIIAGINQMIKLKNAQIEVSEDNITISEDYEGEELSRILSDLLENARSRIAKVVGAQVVQEKLDEFEQQVGPSLPSTLDRDRLKRAAAQI